MGLSTTNRHLFPTEQRMDHCNQHQPRSVIHSIFVVVSNKECDGDGSQMGVNSYRILLFP
jgi:hypothetical protein